MLDRRTLLKAGAAGAAALGSGRFGTADSGAESVSHEAPGAIPYSLPHSELEELTLAELREGMAAGRWSARELTHAYLERIAATNLTGPELRAVIETNPEAEEIAAGLDAERAAGRVRGPLHGIPILLKDNVATADRTATSAGSLALAEARATRDAGVAARLRAAGAVLLGKANLSEWANFRSERSSSGWSGRGGQTRNPYVLDRNPCGSSSGSGVAASANLCAAAVGTETNGSIVCPASANGIVGVKPTVGLLSRAGIIPISHSQDTAGPMARTVADAALLLGALAGPDPRDPATTAAGVARHADYAAFLDPGALRGARIGVARNFFSFHEKVDALMEAALAAMREAGAEVVDGLELDLAATREKSYDVLLYEFRHGLNAYLADPAHGSRYATLAELIAFNEEHRDRELPFFEQEIFLLAEAKDGLESPEYLAALEACRRAARAEGIDALVAGHALDAIVAPTGGPAWPTDLVNGDHFGGGSSSPAAIAGYPNVTVPCGRVHGLPVGISMFAGAWSEPRLLAIAYAFEQATRHRAAPRFLPTLPLGG
ncbi:MAG: amidase [Acidobacteriota bacterium]|nr:amidase [Acidobacteriota bacterium]